MSVFIPIHDKLAIRTDSYCWMSCEPKRNKIDGPYHWHPYRYYPTLEQLLSNESQRAAMLSKAESGTQLLLERENAVVALQRALAPFSYTIHVTGPRPDTGNPVNSSQVTRIPVEIGPHGLKKGEQ